MFQSMATGVLFNQATIEFVAPPGGVASSQWALNRASFVDMNIEEVNGGPITSTDTLSFVGYSEASYSTGMDGKRGPLAGFSYDSSTGIAGGLTFASGVPGTGSGLIGPATP